VPSRRQNRAGARKGIISAELEAALLKESHGDVISLYVPGGQILSNHSMLGEFGRMREVELVASRGPA